MELETVIAELQQLRADFAELKNKFESLLGQAGWQWFKYNTAPAAAPAPWSNPQPINYVSCSKCGIFYSVGSVHFCATGPTFPTYTSVNPNVTLTQAPQNT